MLELNLDVDASLGKRAGLEQALRHAVRTGRLQAGAALPSSRALAADLGFSRATVVSAYEQLSAEGYLTSVHGAGTQVGELHSPSPEPRRSTGPAQRFTHDFRPGEPDGSLFPRRSWQRSVRNTLRTTADADLGYADPRGAPALRSTLAEYLSRSRAVAATAQAISVFAGFGSALGFLGELFASRGITEVAVEDPMLAFHRDILQLTGITPVPLPVDEQGLVADELARSGVRAVFVTPSHQYPLGVTMTPERRTALISWANSCDGWIVEDDYDGEFRYDRQPIGALQGLDPERVIYAGTASKSLIPGLRLSWLVVPRALRRDLGAVKHLRGGTSTLEQLALHDFINRGELDRHLRVARGIYRERQLALVEELHRRVPKLSVNQPAAGLHLTAVLPRTVDEAVLIDAAAAEGIGLMGLESHFAGSPTETGLVLGYSRPAQHSFANALEQVIAFLANATE